MALSEISWWPWLLYRILCLFGWFFLSPLLPCGCGNQPLLIGRDVVVAGDFSVRGDAEVVGSLDVGDDLTVGDDEMVGDDIEFGGEIVELPEPPPPPPQPSPLPPPVTNGDDGDEEPPPAPKPEPEPAILTATVNESNKQTTFAVGESVNLVVIAVGGASPYDLRCLWPDGQFTVINDSSASRFEFSRAIGIPGSGTINCQITAADAQVASVWYAITVK